MVGRSVGELRGRYVQDSLSCAGGDHVHEAQKVLCRVPEAHAASHAAFVVACAAAHVERDHALVLVPDVDHAVELGLICLDLVV